MTTKDLHNNIKPVVGIVPTLMSTNSIALGDIIDLQGYESVEFVNQVSSFTDGVYTPVIKESDAANMAGEAEVADADLLGIEVAHTAAGIKKIGYIGKKRYVTCDIASTEVTTGATVTSTVIKGHPAVAPVA